MEFILKENNGIVCIAIKGRMGSEFSPELEKTIKTIVAQDQRRILFDLGGLEYLRAPALRVILNAAKQINQKRGQVALCALNRYIKEIFEGNRFQGSFAIVDSVESGVEVLLDPARAF